MVITRKIMMNNHGSCSCSYVETFKSEHIRLYKSEFKQDFSKPVLMLALDYHISHQCHNDSLRIQHVINRGK